DDTHFCSRVADLPRATNSPVYCPAHFARVYSAVGGSSRRQRVVVFATGAGDAEAAEEGRGQTVASTGETEGDRMADISKQLNQARAAVGSNLMTINSFGPDVAPTSSRGFKNKRATVSSSKRAAAIPEDRLKQIIARQDKLYEKRKWRLIGDNVFLGLLGTSGAWCISLKAACSYGLGVTLGTAYLVLLSRFVESLGKVGDEDGV
ncbi:unnamed protein product, partial [Sphacelaria rigidula]